MLDDHGNIVREAADADAAEHDLGQVRAHRGTMAIAKIKPLGGHPCLIPRVIAILPK